jgi:hypothetical protein
MSGVISLRDHEGYRRAFAAGARAGFIALALLCAGAASARQGSSVEKRTEHGHQTQPDSGTKQSAHAPTPVAIVSIPNLHLEPVATQQLQRSGDTLQESWLHRVWHDPNASFSGAVALFTLALVGVGIWQGGHLGRSVKAARDAARAAVAAQRPWIKIVDVEVVESLFRPEVGMRLGLLVKIVNIGATPATNVQTWAPMCCGSGVSRIVDARYKISNLIEIGHALFPNDPLEVKCFGKILATEIDEALTETKISNRIGFSLLVCVRYGFVGGSGETSRFYAVVDSGNRTMETLDVRKLPIAPERVLLIPDPTNDTAI